MTTAAQELGMPIADERLIALDSERRGGAVGRGRKRINSGRVHPAEQDARRPLVRNKVTPADRNVKSRRFDACERSLQLVEPFIRPMPNELGGDVQIRWAGPFDIGGGPKLVEQRFETS